MASALINLQVGAFALTGIDVTLKPINFAVDAGTYSLTGNFAGLVNSADLDFDITATTVDLTDFSTYRAIPQTSAVTITQFEFFPIDISESRTLILSEPVTIASLGEFITDARSEGDPSAGGADFPSLYPSSRQWNPGEIAQNSFTSIGGKETRVLLGSRRANDTLTLTFENLEDTEANLIIDHYSNQKGSFTSFAISSELLGGIETTPSTGITETSNQWRYNRPPSVTYTQPNVQTVSVELLQVIP